VLKVAEEDKPRNNDAMPPASVAATAASTSAAAALLAWPPLLLHPWAPALLPGAWCSSAIRSALPGLVIMYRMRKKITNTDWFRFANCFPRFGDNKKSANYFTQKCCQKLKFKVDVILHNPV
jgi:hypothetical protein